MKLLVARWIALLALPLVSGKAHADERWLAGYYVGYQRSIYPPAAVDFDNLTHLLVGRVLPKPDGSLETHLDIDASSGPALAKELAKLARAKGKKSILFVGGAGERDKWRAAAAPEQRAALVKNLVALMDSWGYDGIDLDWEPIPPEDAPLVEALVIALRRAKPGMLLSIPVGWINPNWEKVDPLYARLAAQVDRLNLMTYGMADAWDSWKSWHSAALHSPGGATPSAVDASVNAYVAAGVPKAKLGVGAGFYGSCWAGGVSGPGQDFAGSKVVASDNEISYANIMQSYYVTASYRFDEAAGAPYLTFPSGTFPAGHGPRRCSFLSYEDETSLKLKGAYVKQQGLGGVIVWTLNQGYLPKAAVKNPLLKALYQAMR